MVADLNVPAGVELVPTVREADGLAARAATATCPTTTVAARRAAVRALRAAATADAGPGRMPRRGPSRARGPRGVEPDYLGRSTRHLPARRPTGIVARPACSSPRGSARPRLIDNAPSPSPEPRPGATATVDRIPGSPVTDDTAESDRIEQRAVRLAKRERLIAARGGGVPGRRARHHTIPALRERFADLEADAATGERVAVAGRIVHLRNTGKLCFAALQSGDGCRIQAMVSLDRRGRGVADASGKNSSTSATTSSWRARSSRRAAASSRSWRRVADRGQGAAAAPEPALRALEETRVASATST